LATSTTYLVVLAMQVAGCWHCWWVTEGATHLLHYLHSIQSRPNPPLPKELDAKTAKCVYINSCTPLSCTQHLCGHVWGMFQ